MSETPFVDAKEFEVNIAEAGLEGAESQVYKGKKDNKPIALKIFKDIPHKQILLYQRVTNKLADLHNGNEYVELNIKGVKRKLKVFVVPIEDVISTNYDARYPDKVAPGTISEFIEGDSLFDLDTHYMSSRPSPYSNDPLEKLSEQFRLETGYDNISIIPWNVKILTDQEPNVLAITDIAGAVRKVKPTS